MAEEMLRIEGVSKSLKIYPGFHGMRDAEEGQRKVL